MKLFLGAAAAASVAASFPPPVRAQESAPPSSDSAAVRPGLPQVNEPGDDMHDGFSRIGLSQTQADHARGEVGRIIDAANRQNDRDGGRRTDADRMVLQERIDGLRRDIRLQGMDGAGATAA